jgi:ribosomal-protein-alanine N-acetyltransferase
MVILETERLVLRHQEPGDVEALWALYRNPEVVRFIPDAARSREETLAEIAWFRNGHPRRPELGLWATVLQESGAVIGRCDLIPWTIDGQDEVEVAYLIDPAHWGRGLATEAARAIRDYARDTLGLTRLIALIDADNVASRRVAEKIGLAFEKEGRDEIGPFLLYARHRPAMPEGDSHAHPNQFR